MKKLFILPAAFLLLTGGLWADDSFFSGGFADTESGDSLFGDSAFGEESTPAIEISGGVSSSVRAYVSEDALDGIADLDDETDKMETETEANLRFSYEGPDFKIVSDLDFIPDTTGSDSGTTVSINESYGQFFTDSFNFEAGYMKVVWGKADEFHVVDVLNNLDMSEFLIPDYLEMIDPELMFKLNVPMGMSSMLEMAYVPALSANVYSEEGIWTPAEISERDALAAGFGLTESAYNTDSFDYGQGALHFTSTAGGFDYGFVYYLGYNKTPSFNYSLADSEWWYEYDPMQTFGAEAAYILAGLNLRGEIAYNMTYDYDGSDASVHNNSIQWVGGLDRDIPVSSLNINIQEAGTYILGSDEIESIYDIEYDEDDQYTQNLLILALTDSYLHEKLEAEVILFYHFEDSDYGIYPSLEYTPVDDFTLAVEGRFFGGDDDSLFGQYDENDFIELSVSYNF